MGDVLEKERIEEVEEIDGGEILSTGKEKPITEIAHHEANTARWLAISFIAIFVMTFVVHYAVCAYFHSIGKVETANFLTSFFDKWLSAVIAMTSSVVTYYFKK